MRNTQSSHLFSHSYLQEAEVQKKVSEASLEPKSSVSEEDYKSLQQKMEDLKRKYEKEKKKKGKGGRKGGTGDDDDLDEDSSTVKVIRHVVSSEMESVKEKQDKIEKQVHSYFNGHNL